MVGRDSSLVRLIVAGRELLEDREQRTRAVLALEAHDRRLVVAGRRGDAAADDHEAGLVLGVVLDVGGEHLEPVELGRERVADRGQVPAASTATPRAPPSGGGVRRPRSRRRAASCASQPRHWRDRVRERHDRADVGERRRPGGAQRLSDTGRSISRWISSSLSNASVSRVTDDRALDQFSIGTTPPSTSPRSTAAITSGTDA